MSSGLYHINPSTGDPGNCHAAKGNCPFGGIDDHYTSSESARRAFEAKSEDAKAHSLKAWKRKSAPKVNTVPNPVAPPIGGSSHGRYSGGHGGHGR
jgi:hypothetical protein